MFIIPKNGKGDKLVSKIQTPPEGYQFPLYFRSFFNLSSCLLICPFYISLRKGPQGQLRLEVRSFLLHRVLCFLVQVAQCTYTVMAVVVRSATADMKATPQRMYSEFNLLLACGNNLVFLGILWSQKKAVESVINLPVTPKPRRFGQIVIRLFLVGMMLVILIGAVFTLYGNKIEGFLDKLNDLTFWKRTPFWELSLWKQILVFVLLVLYLHWMLVAGLALICIFISSTASYEVTRSTGKRIEDMGPHLVMKEKLLLLREMKGQIGAINGLTGPILAFHLLSIVVTAAIILVNGQFGNWVYKLARFIVLCTEIISLLIAAEAQRKAKALEERLVGEALKCEGEWREMLICGREAHKTRAFLQGSPGQDGLQGWAFFKITYGFLGSVTTICLSYALIMLQFVATPNSGPKP